MGDVNPIEGAINIVDAMLVFACGLILALAIYWNVDLARKGEKVDIKLGKDVSQLPEVRRDLIETRGEGKAYEKVGTVFRDPETGKMFMITK
ncbi:DUF2149 domain-containing protein [Desulfovirgula thermocuniculi]|uniref:DUF2149 domain-containing protein n=1 Tax=Desulfovirgula thermocuniculi TaxID=348842 RepID=UPI0003FB0771|nr:DUF2149 domain-containing protein [Desulfovirgula thermocuniculi]